MSNLIYKSVDMIDRAINNIADYFSPEAIDYYKKNYLGYEDEYTQAAQKSLDDVLSYITTQQGYLTADDAQRLLKDGSWEPSEVEYVLSRQDQYEENRKEITQFLWESWGKPYIKLLESDQPGFKGDKARAYHQESSTKRKRWNTAQDTLGIFKERAWKDLIAEFTHTAQMGGMTPAESKDYKKLKSNDKRNYPGETIYDPPAEGNPSTYEHEAHSIVGPAIIDFLNKELDIDTNENPFRFDLTDEDKDNLLKTIDSLIVTNKTSKQSPHHHE